MWKRDVLGLAGRRTTYILAGEEAMTMARKCDFSKIGKCNRPATKTFTTRKRTLHLCYIHYQETVDVFQNVRLARRKE